MKMRPHLLLLIPLAAVFLFQGCAPASITSATTAVSTVAADRRTTGTMVEDKVSGEAPTEEDRQAVVDLVKNVEKVTRVHDEITIAAPSSLLSRSADAVTTAKIKAKLIAEQDLSTLHVKVVTENGIAYLMGLVSREEGDIATEVARRTGGVQKVVKLFEYREYLRNQNGGDEPEIRGSE